jgi:hypothetical protein
MHLQILYNGTDVTQYIISYKRNNAICTGIGTSTFSLTRQFYDTYSPVTYGTFIVYEEGIKKGTFYITAMGVEDNGASISIDCQDSTIKLVDWFITQSYTIDYVSYCKYWITKFLNDAGVSYEFDTTESGSVLSNNTSLGLATAYDTILQLCQQSGWFFRVNADGVFIVGKVDVKLGGEDITLSSENEDISIKIDQKDDILRNRVVVWGSANEDNLGWVFAESKTYTPYNYDQTDLRTSVLTNGCIYTNYDAKTLANRILRETEHINYIKEVQIGRLIDASIGQTAFLDCRLYSGYTLITSIEVDYSSSSGYITILTLDERCPRLFAFFGYRNNYVYVGTSGAGVWRKPLEVDGWENYSTGLEDLTILDLAINKSIFACVGSDGSLYARKSVGTHWYPMSPTKFITAPFSGNLFPGENYQVPSGMTLSGIQVSGLIYSAADVECMACDINRTTNEILGVYTVSDMLTQLSGCIVPYSGISAPNVQLMKGDGMIPDDGWVPYSGQYWHSWMVTSPNTYSYDIEPIIVNGSDDVYAYDVANNGSDTFITCLAKIPQDPQRYNDYKPFSVPIIHPIIGMNFPLKEYDPSNSNYGKSIVVDYDIVKSVITGNWSIDYNTNCDSNGNPYQSWYNFLDVGSVLHYSNSTTYERTTRTSYYFVSTDDDGTTLHWELYANNGNTNSELICFDHTGLIRRKFTTGNPQSATAYANRNLMYPFYPQNPRSPFWGTNTIIQNVDGLLYGGGLQGLAMIDNTIWIYSNYYQSTHSYHTATIYTFVPAVPSTWSNRGNLIHGVAKKTDQGDYILLTQTPIITHIEASNNLPLIAYGGNPNMGLGFIEIIPLGIKDEDLDEYTYLNTTSSVTPVSEIMQPPLDLNLSAVLSGIVHTSTYVPDARTFWWHDINVDADLIAFTKVSPTGDWANGLYVPQPTISGYGEIYITDYNNNTTNDLTVPSGVVYQTLEVLSGVSLEHLETTNYQDIPYIFASTNDVPARFFEKEKVDKGELPTVFNEFSTNLPGAEITCIRCDDKV